MLTTQQLTTLKAHIEADPVLNAQPMNSDGAYAIAEVLNTLAEPAFRVWKTQVTVDAVGQAFVSTEVAGLTTGNTNRLQVMASYSGGYFNPSMADVRAGFDSVFGGAGGAGTRTALASLWRRNATRAEKLFAAGTGSEASPAALTFEGTLPYQEIEKARRL